MAAWASILKAIGSVAAWLGADKLLNWLDDTNASAKNLSQDQIIARLSSKLSEIKKSDLKLYNALADKIGQYPEGKAILSPSAARGLRDSYAKAKSKLSDIEQAMSEGDALRDRVSSYAYQPSSYKLSTAGQIDLGNIERSINTYGNKRR